MDWQTLFNITLGLSAALLGWLARTLWDAVQKLATDLSVLREELSRDFVRKDDFKDAFREVKDMLTRIFDKLDGKQDK